MGQRGGGEGDVFALGFNLIVAQRLPLINNLASIIKKDNIQKEVNIF